jgi:hypothetical protein
MLPTSVNRCGRRQRAAASAVYVALLLLAVGSAPADPTPEPGADFVHFESSHVHPIAYQRARKRLVAVNTPQRASRSSGRCRPNDSSCCTRSRSGSSR